MPDNKETDSDNGLDQDDIDLWREMTSDVKPLEGKGYKHPTKPRKTGEEKKQHTKINVSSTPMHTKNTKALQGKDVDRNTMKRLKRGDVAIEGKLDLHGMNQGQAHDALISFIRASEAAGKRCVLVVTGKGNSGRSSEGWLDRKPGVLKQRVPVWLHEGDLSSIVLQVVPAQPKHGGDGALYVYLRRRRH